MEILIGKTEVDERAPNSGTKTSGVCDFKVVETAATRRRTRARAGDHDGNGRARGAESVCSSYEYVLRDGTRRVRDAAWDAVREAQLCCDGTRTWTHRDLLRDRDGHKCADARLHKHRLSRSHHNRRADALQVVGVEGNAVVARVARAVAGAVKLPATTRDAGCLAESGLRTATEAAERLRDEGHDEVM